MNPHPPADWFEFWVRFVCGALLGGFLGLGLLAETTSAHAWLAMPVGGVVVGVVAGWFGDRFWYSLRYLFGWWP